MSVHSVIYYPCTTHLEKKMVFDDVTSALSDGLVPVIINPTAPCKGYLDEVFNDGFNIVYLLPDNIIFATTVPVNTSKRLAYRNNSAPCVASVAIIPRQLTITAINSNPDLSATEYALVSEDVNIPSRGFQTSPIFSTLLSGVYILVSRFIAEPEINQAQVVVIPDPLSATATSTVTSGTGAGDGTITVFIKGGSGDYNVVLESTHDISGGTIHVVPPNKQATINGVKANANLTEPFYTIDVIDNISGDEVTLQVTVTDPVIPLPQGTFFYVPQIQGLQFIHEVDTFAPGVLQTMDNVRFCKRVETSPIWMKVNYYSKVCVGDKHTVQWQSDYPSHEVTVLNYKTNEPVEELPFAQKIQNIGVGEIFAIDMIDNLTPNQSRIYFTDYSAFPVSTIVGDTFGISDNIEGMDGNYTIQAIGFDNFNGKQYIVINKLYTGAAFETHGSGTFYTVLAPFNIFETVVDFTAYAEGCYYVRIRAFTNISEAIPGLSEPLLVKTKHPKTNLLQFANIDAAFDINYSTGVTFNLRVESNNFQRDPAAILNTLRNTTGQSKMLRFLPQRKFLFQTYNLPPWMHEKLFIIFGMDVVALQGVQVKAEEAYANPTYTETFDLASSSITIEQDWFTTYNTNNLNPNNTVSNILRYFANQFSKEFN